MGKIPLPGSLSSDAQGILISDSTQELTQATQLLNLERGKLLVRPLNQYPVGLVRSKPT